MEQNLIIYQASPLLLARRGASLVNTFILYHVALTVAQRINIGIFYKASMNIERIYFQIPYSLAEYFYFSNHSINGGIFMSL